MRMTAFVFGSNKVLVTSEAACLIYLNGEVISTRQLVPDNGPERRLRGL